MRMKIRKPMHGVKRKLWKRRKLRMRRKRRERRRRREKRTRRKRRQRREADKEEEYDEVEEDEEAEHEEEEGATKCGTDADDDSATKNISWLRRSCGGTCTLSSVILQSSTVRTWW